MVKVIKGVITHKFHILIQPPDNHYDIHNIAVHGMNAEHTANAPVFPEVYPLIKSLINGNKVVCHNAAFDISVLTSTMHYYDINTEDISYTIHDTMHLYGKKSLDKCCKECGIELSHHDPLSDAEACAKIFMKYHECRCKEIVPGKGNVQAFFYGHDSINGNLLKHEPENVVNQENHFFNKKVVITGTYDKWPDRRELAKIIKEMGADIDKGISSKTQILIAGEGAGPVKIEKMLKNIEVDCSRQILYEEDLVKILKKYLSISTH
jgi:DNA polymerase-3 subunit epsilon